MLERFDDATARMDQCICIAASLGDADCVSDSLAEFLMSSDDQLKRLFPSIPKRILSSGCDIKEAFSEWAINNNMLGWLVCISTPVMTPREKGGRMYSWGYTTQLWSYGDTLEAAVDAGFEMVAQERKSESAKVTK